MANEEQEWGIIDTLIEKHPPGYERDPAKKIQLLTHVVNSNPATIMTDPEIRRPDLHRAADVEAVEKVIEARAPDALLPTWAGRRRSTCASSWRPAILERYGVS